MPGDFVTQEECERTHAPIDKFETEFKKETNDNFLRVHERLDGINKTMVGVLLAIIGSLAVQVFVAKAAPAAPKIEIRIDKDALKNAIQP